MTSNLTGIYAALAAMDVGLNGAIVPVRNYDELPASVAAADTPLRLLMPLSSRPGSPGIEPVAFGGIATAQWRITDLLLLRPQQAGRPEQAAADIVAYMAAYTGAVLRTRALANCLIESYTFDSGVFTYPAGGTASWFGVDVTLVVKESFR